MASFSKSKLKAAREAISKKDYRSAREAASQVLEFEPSNYTANVFLGLACLEMGDHAPSQQAYTRATELNPEQPLAWQGLSKFYERTEQWQGYYTSLRKLMDIFMKADDAIKCAETLQKYLEIQRSRGTRQDVCDALRLLLPSSPLYPVLSTLPEPDPTAPSLSISYHIVQTAVYNYLPVLEEIVKLTEKDEEESIKREIEKRRTRLGAGRPEQIKNDVNCEVRERSTLPELYNEIINHPNTSDELRRSTENKLLQQKLQLLEALPVVENKLSLKKDLLSEVQDLCNGMVLLDIPNEMAWIFYIESMDVYDIEEYNIPILRRYIMAFPSSHLTTLLKGYFDYMRISIEGVEEEEETLPESREGTQDPISTILDASSYLSDSILAHRIVSEVYRMEEDWENGIKQAERGLQLTNKKAASYGKPLPKVQRAFRVTLAVSLVKFYPPKHHPRASVILDEILSRDPNNVQCLFSKGHVLQYSQQWKDAEAIFGTVVELTDESGEYDVRLEACEERAWCIVKDGRLLEGIEEYGTVIQDLDKEVDKDDKKAQAWWRLGMAYWNLGDEHKETAYKHFITALKRSSTFAPAFTSLGIYYAEYATPPDLDRSSKCFQKAFEIDATEGEAARRLAEGFANESEWGLVEVVARRTIEGEGGLEGGMTGTENTTSRYMPTNAWAWKALGVVELNSKNYLAATQSFQVALRADNNDFIAWQRLGEAYFKSGRHVAAMKALKQALTLKEDDWVCHLLLGEVYKAIGQYPDAIDSYQTALELQPAEITTSLALAEAHLIHSRNYSSEGFSSRAESSAIASIKVCVEILEKNPGFRRVAWKIAADAVYELSKTSAFDDSDAVTVTLVALLSYIGDGTTVNVQGLLDLTAPESVDGLYALKVAAAAYDQRISLDSLNNMAAASAHFDLATALIKLSTRILDSGNKTSILNQAKVLVQKSLRLDPLNNSHWVLWGNLHFVDNPKLAQHAYIKALERDSKNSLIWTNLGLLYLHHGDIELANHALYRAQILDPDYVLAWIGQGLVAAENQHHADSYTLFSHAVDISSETSPADFEFAKRAFERLINSVNKSGLQESEALLTPFHALDRFCKRQPDDPTALHLFALICERLNQIDLALDLVTRCIGLLEKTYEETEDEVTEERYALANGTLGRLKLASQDYSGAVSAFSICLSLLTPETSSDPNKIMRAHALFGSGLAHFKLYELEAALEMFENSLQELTPDLVHVKGHVFILLAQTLWALGSDEARETAKNQLLECITIDPQNLTAMATLAAIGILQSDDSLVDAALAEIRGLTWDKVSELDPANIILQLVVQHHLSEGREKDALSYAQRMVHMDPLNSKIRRALTTLLFQQQKLAAASSVIEGDLRGDSDDTLRLKAVAMIESTTVSLSTAQKAVMMAPWKAENWCTLAYMRSCNQENTS